VRVIHLGWIRLIEVSSKYQTSQMLHHEGTKNTKGTKVLALALSYEVIGAAIEVHRLLGQAS
jgi:hypothetical protein